MCIRFFASDVTVQLFRKKGQKFLHCPGKKGQRDKLNILLQDSLSKSGTGRRKGRLLFFCQNPGQATGQSLLFSMISCVRTSFPVLERPFLFQNILFCFETSFFCFRTSFSCFLCSFEKVILSQDIPGQRSLFQYFCSCLCPGTKGQQDKGPFLSWNKGTTGRLVQDCPGTSRRTSPPLETLVSSQ